MAFAQLTYRESLRDIEACLRAQSSKLYHLGIRSPVVARNTLAHANATRDWRIYAEFAQRLIGIARKLYASDAFAVELKDTVYALDSTLIDLCLAENERRMAGYEPRLLRPQVVPRLIRFLRRFLRDRRPRAASRSG